MFMYLVYSSVYYTLQTVWMTIIFFAPASLVQAFLTKKFEDFGIRVAVDGEESSGKPKQEKPNDFQHQCTMTVYDRRFFKKFAMNNMLAHGEAYMNGWMDSSNLAKQIELLTVEGSRNKVPWLFFMFQLRDQMVTAQNQQTPGIKSLVVADLHYNLGQDLYSAMLDERYVTDFKP